MVAANKGHSPPRKAFFQAFTAFAELRRKHSDAVLFLHTSLEPRQSGVNLAHLLDYCGVPQEAVVITPPFELYHGVDQSRMPYVYSGFDVLLSPSYGEGFGIPIIEAQACGTPVIVNDFSSMSELVGPGWSVGGEPFYDDSQGAEFQSPSIPQLVEALADAYENAESRRLAARAFAQAYDADYVTSEYWAPTLDALSRPREVPALVPASRNGKALRPITRQT